LHGSLHTLRAVQIFLLFSSLFFLFFSLLFWLEHQHQKIAGGGNVLLLAL
jgi:hypothetical protein